MNYLLRTIQQIKNPSLHQHLHQAWTNTADRNQCPKLAVGTSPPPKPGGSLREGWSGAGRAGAGTRLMQGSCLEDLAPPPEHVWQSRLTTGPWEKDRICNWITTSIFSRACPQVSHVKRRLWAWTWADKSSVICVHLLELAREKNAQCINSAK